MTIGNEEFGGETVAVSGRPSGSQLTSVAIFIIMMMTKRWWRRVGGREGSPDARKSISQVDLTFWLQIQMLIRFRNINYKSFACGARSLQLLPSLWQKP